MISEISCYKVQRHASPRRVMQRAMSCHEAKSQMMVISAQFVRPDYDDHTNVLLVLRAPSIERRYDEVETQLASAAVTLWGQMGQTLLTSK